jgi:hypothetical protein
MPASGARKRPTPTANIAELTDNRKLNRVPVTPLTRASSAPSPAASRRQRVLDQLDPV